MPRTRYQPLLFRQARDWQGEELLLALDLRCSPASMARRCCQKDIPGPHRVQGTPPGWIDRLDLHETTVPAQRDRGRHPRDHIGQERQRQREATLRDN